MFRSPYPLLNTSRSDLRTGIFWASYFDQKLDVLQGELLQEALYLLGADCFVIPSVASSSDGTFSLGSRRRCSS